MKILIYQMNIIPGNPDANYEKVRSWVESEVKEKGADIIVLPEMWTTSYTLEKIHEYADDQGTKTISFLRELAIENNINIIGGSFANKVDGKIYNTSIVLNRSGDIVYQYDKIHLVPMLDEPKYLTGGQKAPEVFELEGVKMGLIICYDLRFPEIIRPLALDGAEVLFVVAEWPVPRINHWKTLQTARAIENQMFVVSCNNVGTLGNDIFGGNSMVINPWGETLLAGSDNDEETLDVSIDISTTKDARTQVPIFSSRVPHLYRKDI